MIEGLSDMFNIFGFRSKMKLKFEFMRASAIFKPEKTKQKRKKDVVANLLHEYTVHNDMNNIMLSGLGLKLAYHSGKKRRKEKAMC